jgi:hypothetical protein
MGEIKLTARGCIVSIHSVVRSMSESEPDPPAIAGPRIYIAPYSREEKILEYNSGHTPVTP